MPVFLWGGSRSEVSPNVGASLLAIGPGQSTFMLNDPPHSRAGSLLQVYLSIKRVRKSPQSPDHHQCTWSPAHSARRYGAVRGWPWWR
ncbi:hypothetical protein DKY63_10590 [Pseudomonas putida]|uniref:Uncharacterized protein n=1 Tax=Pseudomonas putida TaxID=303 RepID=A0A2Z4RH99_PSEPU|nr:hypothetical protein DKY63_10590 [Pseudomonas putida]